MCEFGWKGGVLRVCCGPNVSEYVAGSLCHRFRQLLATRTLHRHPVYHQHLVAEFPLRMINRTTGQPMLHVRLGNETTPGDVAAVVLEWTLLSRFTGACFGGKVCG